MPKKTESFVEIEGKVLDIDKADIKKKLQKLGANKVSDYFFKRYVFDVIPAAQDKWIRLRTDGIKTTLTVKCITDDSITGTEEWEMEVSSFEMALIMLKQIGIESRGYQENKRELYELDGVEIAIDEWPKIPPYIEIEASSEEKVHKTLELLGIDRKSLTGKNTEKIYDIYGIDLSSITDLRF